jgi:hypothetical protein
LDIAPAKGSLVRANLFESSVFTQCYGLEYVFSPEIYDRSTPLAATILFNYFDRYADTEARYLFKDDYNIF